MYSAFTAWGILNSRRAAESSREVGGRGREAYPEPSPLAHTEISSDNNQINKTKTEKNIVGINGLRINEDSIHSQRFGGSSSALNLELQSQR
ncbi:hypothetical protein TNCV_4404201 [Trichonephila clavipes]|uniref:Uncharacterized protein n=1 Tax=Trichonephila clavipes TaxID=2585209 RepID=A0A8X6VF97_TRICX|nr:hypothetical protein TNCV_4404201 [Trichonephila clavipes]